MGEGTTLPDGVFFVPEDDSLCGFGPVEKDAYTVWSSEDDDFELMDAFKGSARGGGTSSVIWLSVRWAVLSTHPQAGARVIISPFGFANGSRTRCYGQTLRFVDSDTIAGILMRDSEGSPS